jgi:4-carboxymuconolactone decarboxylase
MDYQPPRIAPPPLETMTETQRRLYQNTIKVLGGPVGPRMVLLNHEKLAQTWAAYSDVIKDASYPKRLRELAILTIARHWQADFEWYAHEKQASEAGLPAAVIEAIRLGRQPEFSDAADALVHGYTQALLERHRVDDALYEQLRTLLGTLGIIELTALIGQYTSVAITLVAHRIMLPPDQAAPFGQQR